MRPPGQIVTGLDLGLLIMGDEQKVLVRVQDSLAVQSWWWWKWLPVLIPAAVSSGFSSATAVTLLDCFSAFVLRGSFSSSVSVLLF